jgi:hypothetical protein
VDAFFDEELPAKVYGFNIEANIVIKDKVQALVIPKEALIKGDTVVTKQGNKLTRVKIIKGVEDAEWVQVKSGLHSISQSIIIQ